MEGPRIDDATATELRVLAEQLRQAEQIRDLTAQHVTEVMSRQMPATTGMAVHPASLRQAAASIIEEEAARDDAERALAALGEKPEPAPAPPEPPAPGPAHAQLRRHFPLLVLVIVAVAALAGAAFPVPVAARIVLAAGGVALLLAAALVWRARRRATTVTTDQPDGPPRPPGPDPEAEWLVQRSKLEIDRDRALERLRSARRQWETLAGPNADPRNLDAVLRLHDPQYRLISLADDTSPTVRTANALHRRVIARWRVRWAALGYDEPPSLDRVEDELARLRE